MGFSEVREFKEIVTRYFEVDEISILEQDVFDYYSTVGYIVFHDYLFYMRGLDPDSKGGYKYTGSKQTDSKRKLLLKMKPQFNKGVVRLFKRNKNGEPDLLLYKDGEWSFVEVKITDSLKPNQLIFIRQLSSQWKTEVHQYVCTADVKKDMLVNTPVKEMEQLHKLFDKALEKYSDIRRTKHYKPYWVVISLLLDFPQEALTTRALDKMVDATKLHPKKISCYLALNKVKVIGNALRKLQAKERPSKKEKHLMEEYKVFLGKNNIEIESPSC